MPVQENTSVFDLIPKSGDQRSGLNFSARKDGAVRIGCRFRTWNGHTEEDQRHHKSVGLEVRARISGEAVGEQPPELRFLLLDQEPSPEQEALDAVPCLS